jgi:hypothetical protein
MTVEELLGRMSSREISDWAVFFLLQHEEMEQNRRESERGSQAPVEGKREAVMGQAAQDAITRAREEQGLDP